MKKLSMLLLSLIIAVSATPVFAANTTDILNGTPTVDGKLDDMYKESAKVEIGNLSFYTDGKTAVKTAAAGTSAYFLWDSSYLYICTVVNDTTTTAKVDSAVDYTKWNSCDNIEHYVRTSDGKTGGQVHIAAIGEGLRFEHNECDVAKCKTAAAVTDTGYVTEIAIPLSIVTLKADSKIGYSLQYNDFVPADKATIASGEQNAAKTIAMTLSAKTVTPAKTETKAAPAAATPAAAAKTADPIALAALAASVSAAGIVISKKRSK